MEAAEQLGARVGLKSACTALGVNRAALYRRRTRQADTSCDETAPPSGIHRYHTLSLSDSSGRFAVNTLTKRSSGTSVTWNENWRSSGSITTSAVCTPHSEVTHPQKCPAKPPCIPLLSAISAGNLIAAGYISFPWLLEQ